MVKRGWEVVRDSTRNSKPKPKCLDKELGRY